MHTSSRTRARRLAGLVILGAALLATQYGCKNSGGGSGSGPAGTGPASGTTSEDTSHTPITGDTIEIGEYASMSGPQVSFGKSSDEGIKLATDEANAAGGINGKKIEIQVEDDASDSGKAETAVRRLISEKHVSAVLGEVASSASLAGGKVCQDNKVPMISPASTKTSVTQIGDYIFRVCFIDPYQSAVVARFAHDALHANKVAIYTNKGQAYSVGFSDDFKAAFTKMGGTIVAEQSYEATDTDFSGALTAIKATNPDAILVPGYYSDAGSIATQARSLGITVPLLGGDGWDSDILFKTGGTAVNGCYFSDHMSVDNPNPVVSAFVTAYKAKWHHMPDAEAALNYDAAKVMFDAIKRAMKPDKSFTRADLRDAIASTKDFPGVTGAITINADRNADKPAVIIAVKNGQFKYAATIADPSKPMEPAKP